MSNPQKSLSVPLIWYLQGIEIQYDYKTKSKQCLKNTLYNIVLQVVKVADFGVARVKAQSGVMTAETGTYRWMAPEVFVV